MADHADSAADYQALANEQALQRHARHRQAQNARPPRVECITCGGRIGTRRKQANPQAQRCIDCQQQHELQERIS